MQLQDLIAAANHAAAAKAEVEALIDALDRLHETADPSLHVLESLFEKVALVNQMMDRLDNRQG